jgi:hypothetical protein
MCNIFHERDMKPIPKDGVGFKIFTVIRAGETLTPLDVTTGIVSL